MIGKIKKYFSLVIFLVISVCASAQDGTYGAYSPYSIYGIGDISKEGTAYNKSMGGTGIATRNRRVINYLNPAAVTARDVLSFMADFGLVQKNTYYHQGNMNSANNTFNIYNLVMSFPIYRSSAFMVGITPYSDVGYDFSSVETNPDIIGNTGNITYDSYGTGSLYQLFVGAGATFWRKFSVGAEFIYYFGNLDKVSSMNFSDNSYISLNNGDKLNLRGATGKLGLQYQQDFGNDVSLIFGATYKMSGKMKGYSTNYEYDTLISSTEYSSSTVDTLANRNIRFADELGLGISVKKGEKWSAEFNYLRSDWRKSGFDSAQGFAVSGDSKFSATVSQSFRAGFEITPNRNDIRYYLKTCAYRIGAYYDKAYYKLDGNNVNSMGVTLGVTLPVFKWYNGISLGVDLGQKSSMKNNMVRERYAMFVIGFNIHDIWFRKVQYE